MQAMAIVQDRLNANKPPPPTGDPKTGKLAPGQINNNRDLDVEIKKEEPSFFGSFFARDSKNTVKKKSNPHPLATFADANTCHISWMIVSTLLHRTSVAQQPAVAYLPNLRR